MKDGGANHGDPDRRQPCQAEPIGPDRLGLRDAEIDLPAGRGHDDQRQIYPVRLARFPPRPEPGCGDAGKHGERRTKHGDVVGVDRSARKAEHDPVHYEPAGPHAGADAA